MWSAIKRLLCKLYVAGRHSDTTWHPVHIAVFQVAVTTV